MTLLLALDTSTSTASVAVYDGERVLSETTWLAGREHSSRLLVEAQMALARISLTNVDLSGLVVARGPGSFTGVRVALSLAKGIAAALHVPVWGVSSLDALARAARDSAIPVRALLEAGRGRYATALYRGDECIQPPRLATIDQLLELIEQPTLVIGELNTEARARLSHTPNVELASVAACARRAAFLAELGWLSAQRGDPGDVHLLDAIYIS